MADPGLLLGRLLTLPVRRDAGAVDRAVERLALTTHEEFARQVQRHLHATPAAARPRSLTERFLAALGARAAPDPTIVGGIALAKVAFSRSPADLPAGSVLRDEQVEAALALAHGRVLQMDTGEGKTYVLMAAAVALLGRWPRVYVLTPNEYLAERDAWRARPFFDELGIRVGLCAARTGTSAADDGNWGAQVVYTTLDALAFKRLNDDLALAPPENPVLSGALLLDEIDAILFDETGDPYTVVTPVRRTALEWDRAFALAEELGPADVVDMFAENRRVHLTPQAWASLPPADDDETVDPWRLGRLVEAAYTALRVARENVDYVLVEDTAVQINPSTGIREPGVHPTWLAAVRHLKGLPQRPATEELFSRTSLGTLTDFRHVAGASGTAGHVLLDMLFALGPKGVPGAIAPAVPRHRAKATDLVYTSAEHALQGAAAQALVQRRQRPVLVAAMSHHDAHRFAMALQALDPAAPYELVLEGSGDLRGPHPFAASGEVGALTVTTLHAARGTDIRLTDDAVAAGGLHLIGLGRTREGRLDRQFLGRAGRNGQPYTACFHSSVDSELLRGSRDRLVRIMTRLNFPPEVPIEHKTVSTSLRQAQAVHFMETRWGLIQRVQSAHLRTALEDEFVAGMHVARRFQRADDADSLRELADELVGGFVEAHVEGREPGPALAVVEESLVGIDMDAVRGCVRDGKIDAGQLRTLLVDQIAEQLDRFAELVRDHDARAQLARRLESAQAGASEWLAGRVPAGAAGQAPKPGEQPTVLPVEEAERLVERWEGLPQQPEPADDGLADLAAEVSAAYRVAPGISARERRRTPPLALRYAVIEAWRSALRERARQEFDLSQSNDPLPVKQYRRARLYQDAHPRLRAAVEFGLIDALLRCGEPARLAQLFRLHDSRVPVPPAEAERSLVPWAQPEPGTARPPNTKEAAIQSFVAQERARAAQGVDPEALVRSFLERMHLSSLDSAARCAGCVARWEASQRGLVPAKVLRQHVRVLNRFLAHAAAHQLIPEAPKPPQVAAARGARLLSALRDARIAFGAAQLALVVALLVALALVRPLRWPLPTDGVVGAVDELLLWGTLASGALLGPWLVATVAGSALRWTFSAPDDTARNIALGPVVAAAAVLGALLAGGRASVLWAVALFVLSPLLWRLMQSLRSQLGLSVPALLVASSAAAALGASLLDGTWPAYAPTAALVACLLASAWLRAFRVGVIGGHVTSLAEDVDRRESSYTIRVGVNLRTHLLAGVLAGAPWLALDAALGRPGDSQTAAWVAYAGCYALLAFLAARRTLRPDVLTAQRLHGERLQLAEGGRRMLDKGLARQYVVDSALAVATVAAGVWAVATPGALSGAPFVLVPVAALSAHALLQAARSVGQAVAGTAAGATTPLRLAAGDEPLEGDRRRWWRRAVPRMWVALVAAYTLLVHLLDALDVLAFLRSLGGSGAG